MKVDFHGYLRILFLIGCCASLYTLRAEAAGAPRINQTQLERMTAALTTLHDLSLSTEQLTALQTMCKDCAAHSPPTTARAASENYRNSLRKLRDALVDGDDSKIDSLEAKVEGLRDSEKIDPDTDVPISDASRAKAPQALALLSTSQIAQYIAARSDDVPDATDTINDALTACRTHQGDEYDALRAEAAEQVGMLLVGLDRAAAGPIEKSVSDLLDGAHALTDADFQSKHDDLIKRAGEITRGADAVESLRHWLQREMADLLSNPAASDAIALKLKPSGSKQKEKENQ